MENETAIVYKCPFCPCEIWFTTPEGHYGLALHLYHNHLQEALIIIAKQNKTKVKKSHKKWMIE